MRFRRKILWSVVLAVLAVWGLDIPSGAAFAQSKAKGKDKEKVFEEKLAAIKTDDPKAYCDLGVWCQQNKLETQAVRMFEKAIELAPDNVIARQKSGYIKYKGRWIKKGEEEKVDYLEKLAALKDDDLEGHYQLAVWCKGRKMPDEARAQFEKVIILDANHTVARKELGYVKFNDIWMTPDEKLEIVNKEKGLVKYGGEWMKPDEMKMLMQKERSELKWEFLAKFKTRIFTIYTDFNDEADKQDIAQAGDNVYDAFVWIFSPYIKKENLQRELPEIKMYYYQKSKDMISNCAERGIKAPSQYGFALGNQSFQAKDTMLSISDSVGEVILHEGCHILDSNFIAASKAEAYWITEGLSCYFQSLQKKNGKFVIGERKDMWELRGPTKFYKLDKFCDFNRTQWDNEITQSGNYNIVYGQASALFRFFISAENGKYKDKFMREVVIGRRSSAKEMAEIFGFESINDIEDAFIEFANTLYVKKISAEK